MSKGYAVEMTVVENLGNEEYEEIAFEFSLTAKSETHAAVVAYSDYVRDFRKNKKAVPLLKSVTVTEVPEVEWAELNRLNEVYKSARLMHTSINSH